MFNLVNFGLRLKAKQKQILFVLSGLRKRTDRLKRANCPVMVEARSNKDGSWTITKAVLEHKGHEVSEKLYAVGALWPIWYCVSFRDKEIPKSSI